MKFKFSTSRLLLVSLVLLLLLSIFTYVAAGTDDEEDLDEIQELIAIDNEQETEDDSAEPTSHFESRKKSEAEVLGKAQRIVLELNSDNIKRVLAENEYVLLLGYAPWDGRSAELMPKFAEAANLLKSLGSTLLMAKLDSERHPQAASSIGIKGLPTLLLFVNGTSQAYTGGFSSEEIVTWARKKTGMPVIRISSVAEATEFLKQHSVYAVGSFSEFEGYEYEQFYEAAVADNEIQFVETSSLEAAKALFPEAKENTAIPSFFLVKNEPEHCTSLDGILSLERILRFLEDNKLPLVNVMTDFNSAKIYSRVDKLQVYVFAVAEALNEMIIDDLREISRKFKSKILFIAVDIGNDNLAKPILSLFGLEESKGTVVVAFNYVSNSKYLLESNATPRNVEDFCSKLAEGSLHPFFKSQPVPENERSSSSGGTLSVVGKTFDELILRSTENVVLEVHTPWCIKCEAASKQIQKLAKHFEGLDGLVFARLDASLNEVPNLNVEDYPALLFFPAGNKSNPVKLPTNSNLKELASLINTYLKGRHESPGGAFGGNRGARPVPPEKGVFPLDHMHLCDLEKKGYLDCLKEKGHTSQKCRQFSRKYLECRMEKNLMAKQEMSELGFGKEGEVQSVGGETAAG